MAKKPKSPKSEKKAKRISEEWEVSEDDFGKKDKGKGLDVGNNVLWIIFILIFLLFISLPFLAQNGGSKDLQSEYVNGIKISAQGDPMAAVKNLKNLHIEAKMLDDSADAVDALNEILVILGTPGGAATGGAYTLYAGITKKTGITIRGKEIRIEGSDRDEFWIAIWTLDSILSDTTIESDVELYRVQDILGGKDKVYLLQDIDNACSPYARIISAEGDILSSLGFKQAQYGFSLHHYQVAGGACSPFSNLTQTVPCPSPGNGVYVITMKKGDSNRISITDDEMTFQYAGCSSVDKVSVLVRDLIYPNIVSSMSGVELPTEL